MPAGSTPPPVVVRHGEDPDDVIARIRAERPAAAVCPFVLPRDVLARIGDAASVPVYGVHDLVPRWDHIAATVCERVGTVLASGPPYEGWSPLLLCAERIAIAETARRKRAAFRAGARELLGIDLDPRPMTTPRRVGRDMGNPFLRVARSLEHRSWPWRARRHRPATLPQGGTWAISSYVNYGRAMARAAGRLGGIDGLLLLGPGGAAGHDWPTVLHGPALAVPAGPGPVEQLRSYLRARVPDLEPPLRSTLEEIVADTALLGRWASAAAQARAFLDRVRPERIVVGNEYTVERIFAELAHRRGVPATLVLHGLPYGLYRIVPFLADRVLVWQGRWRGFFAPATSDRVEGLDPMPAREPVAVSVYTGPARLIPYASEELLRWVLFEGAARVAEVLDLPLVVRLHPADLPRVERRALRRLRRRHPDLRVRVDRDGDPYDILASSAMTITAHSTVSAESAAAGIPTMTVDVVDSDPGRWLGAQGGHVGWWRDSYEAALAALHVPLAERMGHGS